MNLDNALGIHAQAVVLRGRRSESLAANIANAETPQYKARDIDFRATLGALVEDAAHRAPAMAGRSVTQVGHIPFGGQAASGGELLYRVPTQPALDGNTVDAEGEKARFMQNALQYQASLMFLNRRVQGLLLAIKGQ